MAATISELVKDASEIPGAPVEVSGVERVIASGVGGDAAGDHGERTEEP